MFLVITARYRMTGGIIYEISFSRDRLSRLITALVCFVLIPSLISIFFFKNLSQCSLNHSQCAIYYWYDICIHVAMIALVQKGNTRFLHINSVSSNSFIKLLMEYLRQECVVTRLRDSEVIYNTST